jgi:hypothetical protein
MKTTISFSLAFILLLFIACNNNTVSKEREKQIVDSVTHYLTGKPPLDSAKEKRIEELKAELKKLESDSTGSAFAHKATNNDLKTISFDYDYDQKLFNKKSDIDGHIFNNNKTVSFKSFTFKIVGRDKKGIITKSFSHTVYKTLRPHQSNKFTIRFVDPEKTKDVKMSLISAEVE